MARYAYLGPSGTFTEAALRQITTGDDELIPYANVTAALDAVRLGEVGRALVPIENSVEGVVARTLDELATGDPLVITAETTLPVTFALMVLPENVGKPITRIATHPHAESQCRSFIARELPGVEIIMTNSTAAAAAELPKGEWDAAIAAPFAADKYGATIIAQGIGDNEGAVTRFVLVEKPREVAPPSGNDRTSLVAFIDNDHPGALLEILQALGREGINLTFIQSRPTGRELGHYHFIMDIEAHINEERVQRALVGVGAVCDEIRLLGSYPRISA